MTIKSCARPFQLTIALSAILLLFTVGGGAQTPVSPSVTQPLLEKAHALEVRGRLDMASQMWQQVLLADPNNAEALGGLARAAKLDGNSALTSTYLEKMKALNPNDPNIARVEAMGTEQNKNAQLQQAGKLAEAGQYSQAMTIYRQAFGATPPAGDWSLAYYETESATEDGRPHAIAGLRGLVEKYPQDSRYQIALGRILTYNPRTRAEGRKLLLQHPKDPQAVEALRQSLLWDSANPASSGEIKAYLATHRDPQLAQALKNQRAAASPAPGVVHAAPSTPPSASVLASRARSAEEIAAYKQLNQKHIDAAEKGFKEILAKDPENARALAGMGYVRMQQSNFSGAISYLEQARHDSASDPTLNAALDTSRFWFTMGEAQISLNESDLITAEKQYRTALLLRPTQPEALEGLGGTLLQAQQPEPATAVFETFVKVQPTSAPAWRGLFMAEYDAGNAPLALSTEQRIPAAVHAELMKDPSFLRTLASAYSSVGRDADAAKVLQSALDLPFPDGGKGLKADTQMQYAALLFAANRMDQAAGLYRQVLAADHDNAAAWQGLIRVEHAMAHDTEALQTVESMPPATYATAMRDPGFQSTVASIYQSQKKLDIAQDLLEKSIAGQTTAGQKPAVPILMQLAGVYLQRGDTQRAFAIYQQVLTDHPDRADAWLGMLTALHVAGRDKDALAQLQQMPAPVRAQLESNVDFSQTMGSIYVGTGNSAEAQVYSNRVQQHYAVLHTAPPAEVDIQNAWLLYNSTNDAGLYRQLMSLGGRSDLTDQQRATVQAIWTNWAVRRANQSAAAGNPRRALAILNATAHSFPDNPAVIKALANGYVRAGQPSQSVLIYKAQDMSAASSADYQAAIGAALAANDMKDAEQWLRSALTAYPDDPQILILGAKFEQARGDSSRAIEYYHASLRAMPKQNPAAELASELSLPAPTAPVVLPSAGRSQDLAALLAPANSDMTPVGVTPPGAAQAYLPSYVYVNGAPMAPAVQPYMPGAQPYVPGAQPYVPGAQPYLPGAQPYSGIGVVPPYMTNPVPATPPPADTKGRLKDYVPQSEVSAPQGSISPRQAAVASTEVAQTLDRVVALVLATDGPLSLEPRPDPSLKTSTDEVSAVVPPARVANQSSTIAQDASTTQDSYGPFIAYVAPAVPVLPTKPAQMDTYTVAPVVAPVQLGRIITHPEVAQAEVTDVLPTARYVANAKAAAPSVSSHPDIAAAQAAAIRRQQSNPDSARTGESKPPAEDYSSTLTANAQYTAKPQYQPAPTQGSSSSSTATASDTGQQQYPQPRLPGSSPEPPRQPSTQPTPARRRSSRTVAASPKAAPTVAAPPATVVAGPTQTVNVYTPVPYMGLSYPGVGAPLSGLPYPVSGPTFPLATPNPDAELVARNLPPLRGGSYRAVPLGAPLSPRAEAESELATLEGSYSGWVGGTGVARYRSGTPGLNRLYDIEAPVEASVTFKQSMRLSVIPKTVFLSSGQLDTASFAGATNVPFLGTLPANAVNTPNQQFANGIGGELQLTTRNLGLAVGYTPYEFLVENVTGRVRWRPAGGHITLYGERDPVKDTQLSYAGLRDPGSSAPGYSGNVWGGVISTSGGVRLDVGNNGSGFYVSGAGGALTGKHVLTNTRFEGAMGAYFQVKTWPQAGVLTVGGALFGMHYENSELGMTYGHGGYFSPSAYFLASVPVSFTGSYRQAFHYTVSGSVGFQTFQQERSVFYPLDAGLQASAFAGCMTAQLIAHTCGEYPVGGDTSLNYGINAEGAYRVADHWYTGAFVSGNNTNNYNTVSAGFFFRYVFRSQHPSEGYPTGLFPVEGFRPVQVP